MVLVVVGELVVDIDWLLHLSRSGEGERATLPEREIHRVGNQCRLDLVRHDVERNAKRQEDSAKHNKDDHGAAVAGHGSPSVQILLLESVAFERFKFLLATLLFLFCDFHIYNYKLIRFSLLV